MVKSTPTTRGTAGSSTSCTTTRESGRFVLTVEGELDVAAVAGAELAAALSSYRSDEPVDVVLDLAGVSFLDSSGLSWLMNVRSAAALANRRVRLRRSSPSVDKVLDMTRLRRYFPAESVAPKADVAPTEVGTAAPA